MMKRQSHVPLTSFETAGAAGGVDMVASEPWCSGGDDVLATAKMQDTTTIIASTLPRTKNWSHGRKIWADGGA